MTTMMPPVFAIVAHLSVVLIVLVLLASDDVIIGVHCLQLQAAGPAAANNIHARRIAATSITTTTILSSTSFSASRSSFFTRSSLFAISSGESSSSSSALSNTNNNDYGSMTTLPRHPTNHDANEILSRAETALQIMHEEVIASYASSASSLDGIISDDDDIVMLSQFDANANVGEEKEEDDDDDCNLKNLLTNNESVYANSYVDLGKVDTVGFDFDYTLVTYTTELLSLIYDMSLKRLVQEKEYPREMLSAGLKFDPFFSIRGESINKHKRST